MARKKRTPEEQAAWEKFKRESDARIAKLRELIAKGEAELEARQSGEGRPAS